MAFTALTTSQNKVSVVVCVSRYIPNHSDLRKVNRLIVLLTTNLLFVASVCTKAVGLQLSII